MTSGPISGATVQVYQGTTLITAATTDVNGNVSFNLPFGQYNVVISKNGSTTVSYLLVVTQVAQEEILNLPQNPIQVPVMAFSESMSDSASASIATTTSEGMSDLASVSITPAVSEGVRETPAVTISVVQGQSLTEATSVVASITVWTLIIQLAYQDPSLSQGIVSPSSPASAGNGVSISTTATTKQYSLYSYEIADGATVNNNSATTFELVNTAHPYTFVAQPLGSRHLLVAVFSASWEAMIGVSGPGTTNRTGTFEVANGQTINATASPNSGHSLLYWMLDGEIVSTSASFTCPAQPVGTSHVLTANFQ
jgi:hypothetical protein